jgi:hypothetical protein
VRWAYFDATGKCVLITTERATVLSFPHEREVPYEPEYKPNTTRLNLTSGLVETFPRPAIPPPVEAEPAWMTRMKALEERVTKLEHP